MDKSPQKVTVTSGETNTFPVSDEPAADPTDLQVNKQDPETEGKAQGTATLAGAQFTFRYYNGFYNASNLPSTATRTWVLQTNADGEIHLTDGDRTGVKVSGDDFYRDENNRIVVPVGTLAVTETKAPDGYLLGYYENGVFKSPKTYITKFEQASSGSDLIKKTPVNYDGSSTVQVLNIDPNDTVKRGNVEGVKIDSETTDGAAQGAATLAGAEIEVVNRTGEVVVSPEDGTTEVADGEVVCTLVTGTGGSFSTTAASLNG